MFDTIGKAVLGVAVCTLLGVAVLAGTPLAGTAGGIAAAPVVGFGFVALVARLNRK